jgi:hypothetical protein
MFSIAHTIKKTGLEFMEKIISQCFYNTSIFATKENRLLQTEPCSFFDLSQLTQSDVVRYKIL